MAHPVLSLVTGTRNREEDFRRLLDSVQRNTEVDWEMVVADASDEPIRTENLTLNVRVIPERPRLGHSRGYNVAFRAAHGKWVIWLNDDCEVLPGYAEAAIYFMENRPTIGLGVLKYSNRGGHFTYNWHHDMPYANFGILSKEFGDQIGWFDEELRMYGCDNSLAFRVLIAGRGIAVVPNAYIVHYECNDAERDLNQYDRFTESDRLNQKYAPYLDQMKRTYAQFA